MDAWWHAVEHDPRSQRSWEINLEPDHPEAPRTIGEAVRVHYVRCWDCKQGGTLRIAEIIEAPGQRNANAIGRSSRLQDLLQVAYRDIDCSRKIEIVLSNIIASIIAQR